MLIKYAITSFIISVILFSCSSDPSDPGGGDDVTWTESLLRAPDAQPDDWFGNSVAISGNYAIVGAPQEDGGAGSPAANAGAAYIFQRNSNGTWSLKATLHASDIQASDQFGFSVAIDGDYAAVGAPDEDGGIGDPITGAGAVYVFERDESGNWPEKTVLRYSDPTYSDDFGHSLGISGNYLIVGADAEDGNPGDTIAGAGAAIIYERNGSGTWEEKATLHGSDLQTFDWLGWSVSINGSRAIVGAWKEDGGAGDPVVDAGAAYIFERTGSGTWEQKAILHASDLQGDDRYGVSVSIRGDYAIVGACFEDGGSGNPSVNTGAAYIYKRNSSGVWEEKELLHAGEMQPDDRFGYSVAMGVGYAFVSSYCREAGDAGAVANAGAVHIFKENASGAWDETEVLFASDYQENDFFGYNINTDGNAIIIGAIYEDGGIGDPAANAGAVYIYELK